MNNNEDSMASARFSSLGIGVDNLSMDQAVDRVVELVREFRLDGRPRLVATLNVDFMVNALGYAFSRPAHPELLDILRSADLVTADGFPVVLLSRIMGSPIRERVTGADLVPRLAARAAQEKLSIYLLGGAEGSADAAATRLKADSPALRIAGTSAPMVHVSGEGLSSYHEDDKDIVDEVNSSGADILLIGFGNPKQEQWFHRNRYRLRIPVSIGVGGSFEFIAGRVKRAPPLLQKLNLEWLFRISQDPARLWKRYARGMFKLALLSLPILLIRARELMHLQSGTGQLDLVWNTLWGSRQDVIHTVQLPAYVTQGVLSRLRQDMLGQVGMQRMLIIDCSRVRHIELAANMEFFELGRLFANGTVNGMLLGLRSSVQRVLQAGRIMDACQNHVIDFDSLDLRMQGDGTGSTGCRSYVLSDAALIYLTGRVTGESLSQLGFDVCVSDMSRDRPCVIDLRYVDLLDSSAAGQLLKLINSLPEGAHQVLFSGASVNTRNTLKHCGLNKKLSFVGEAALRELLFQPRTHRASTTAAALVPAPTAAKSTHSQKLSAPAL